VRASMMDVGASKKTTEGVEERGQWLANNEGIAMLVGAQYKRKSRPESIGGEAAPESKGIDYSIIGTIGNKSGPRDFASFRLEGLPSLP